MTEQILELFRHANTYKMLVEFRQKYQSKK